MQSKATSVAAYLKDLPPDRKPAIEAVRKAILAALSSGYEEGMQYGMISYFVPHSVYPPGYHCDPRQPLPFVGLANQKQHISVYMMGLYVGCVGDDESKLVQWFRDEWSKTGKKLDMGKSCIRFKHMEDVALDVIAAAIKKQPAKVYIETYEKVLADNGTIHKGKKNAAATAARTTTKPAATPKAKLAKKILKKTTKKRSSKIAAR